MAIFPTWERSHRFVWFIWLVAFLSVTHPATAQQSGIENFRRMKHGVFVHYVWGGKAYDATLNPDGSLPGGLDNLAERFDAERFADDLATLHAEYVIFTAWHANMNCLWPSPKMQAWLPTHTSRRDLLRDMIHAVRARGIRIILYTHPSDGHDLTPEEQAITGWGPNFDFARWNDFINDVYGDLIARYGRDIDGVYLDENCGNNGRYVDYVRLRKTLKAGNPNLLMLQNDYGKTYNADLGHEELYLLPSTDSDTWPARSIPSAVLLSENWWASKAQDVYTPKFSAESMLRFTVLKAGVESSAGGVAWAAGNYPGGGWENGVFETLRAFATLLKPIGRSITNTYASTSYVTKQQSKIQDLAWGVATRSVDDRSEFIHVLTPPAGRTLHLRPPADGKLFGSAKLLANGHKVLLQQDQSGVALTLRDNDMWGQLDTVIELSVRKWRSTHATNSESAFTKRESQTNPFARMNATITASTVVGSTNTGPTPGMARWFDASRLKLSDGTKVSRWEDLSGQDSHAIRPADDNAPPTFVADAGTGTGLGALQFSPGRGLNPALSSGALMFRADARVRTVFTVFKGSSFLLTDYGATHFHRPDDDNPASPLWAREFASRNVLDGETYVNGQRVDGTKFAMPTNSHNGFNLVTVVTTGNVTVSGFNRDRFCHAGDQHHAEVLIYDFPLNEQQRRQTEAYLTTKWFGPEPATTETK